MQAHQLFALALALAALALLLVAGLVLARVAAQRRTERTLGHALDERALQAAALTAAAARATDGAPAASKTAVRAARPRGFKGLFEHLVHVGIRWLDTPFGRQVVAEEDRRLLEQCGFVDTRTRGLFLVSRLLGALAVPVVAGTLARGQVEGTRYVVLVVIAMMAGFMLPKILLKRRAGKRRRRVVDELPLLVDLLRLLQGVGLSLDQSLQVMVNDFRSVLPVLSNELEIAQRQFATGPHARAVAQPAGLELRQRRSARGDPSAGAGRPARRRGAGAAQAVRRPSARNASRDAARTHRPARGEDDGRDDRDAVARADDRHGRPRRAGRHAFVSFGASVRIAPWFSVCVSMSPGARCVTRRLSPFACCLALARRKC
ncbi:Flp pilus assembly protein TadB [Paraburkholderia bryophila]|uniref:Flp pilus assembly protein TadB n=1 Tax=Paraburkholderia bryophila TaxID=420952 RepID=A0A7Z0B3X6_9BURK|nr:Flp pilus assembly protein TadB [Paraburkholderia bryophila]